MTITEAIDRSNTPEKIAVHGSNASENRTPRQIINQFRNSEKFKKFSLNTQSMYGTALDDFLTYCQENEITDINDVDDKLLHTTWLESLRQRSATENAVQTRISGVSAAISWYRNEILDPNASRVLDEKQVENLIQLVQSPHDAALILIPLETGAILQEILEINLEDLQEDENGFSLFLNGVSRSRIGESKPRTIQIDQYLAEKIKTQINSRLPYNPTKPLFSSQNSKRLRKMDAEQMLKEYGNRIDIPNLGFRALRNTFIAGFEGTQAELDAILGKI